MSSFSFISPPLPPLHPSDSLPPSHPSHISSIPPYPPRLAFLKPLSLPAHPSLPPPPPPCRPPPPQVGSQTPTYAIQQEHAHLRESNEAKRKRVDEVLTQRLTLEQKGRQAEAKIQEVQQNMDARLSSMPPSQRQQYSDLVAEQAALTQEARRFEEAMDELDRQLNTQEGELGRNPLKQRCVRGCWDAGHEGGQLLCGRELGYSWVRKWPDQLQQCWHAVC